MSKITGIKVYDHVMSMKNKLDSDRVDVLRKISQDNSSIQHLESQIVSAIQKISQIRFNEVVSAKDSSRFTPAEVHIFDMANSKRESAIRTLNNQNADLVENEAKLANQLSKKQEELNKVNKEISGIKNNLLVKFKDNPNLVELIEKKKFLEEKIDSLQQRLIDLKRTSKDSINEYEKDKFFSYLLNRKFGTENYSGNFITRYFDNRLARYSNFSAEYKKYLVLTQLPVTYQADIDNARQDLAKITPIVDSIVKKDEEDAGMPKLVEQKDKIKNDIELVLANIKTNKSRINNNSHELSLFNIQKDSYYLDALASMNKLLNSFSLDSLKNLVEKSSNTEDDKLFNQIIKSKETIEQHKRNVSSLNIDLKAIEANISNMESTISKMRSNNINSKRVHYDSSVLDNLTYGNNSDVLTSIMWWSILSNSYTRTPEPEYDSYSSRSSSSSSSSSSSWSSSSSSDSSSSWSSGSSFGDSGGFSSGDSF